MRIITPTSFLIILFACNVHTVRQAEVPVQLDTLKNRYASGFRILKNKSTTIVEVYNPWQLAKNISIKYYLKNEICTNKNQSQNNCIKIPVNRVVCMSTSYIAFLDALNEINSIKGISGSGFINNSIIKNRITKNEIHDVGYEQSLNYELLINLKPDVVFAYGVGGEISEYLNKFKELGIQVVLVGEYLESNPLAKAEWLKFFAEFFNKQDIAKIKFDSVADQYNKLKSLANEIQFKPSVIVNLPWNGSWLVAGGKSYIAKLIEDAGGNYLWKNFNSSESVPIDLETVFHQALDADFWINIGSVNSKAEILSVDSRFGNLLPFKKNKLFNNNALQNNNGGNDFWESGAVNPHLILKDLIVILHPELLPDQKLYYYKKIY